MPDTWTPNLLQASADFSAMVFEAKGIPDALQSLANALGVQTVAILRTELGSTKCDVLAQNTAAHIFEAERLNAPDSADRMAVALGDTKDAKDTLVLHARLAEIGQNQRKSFLDVEPYLATLWASRLDSFERALCSGRSPATQSILHSENPYGLTRSELRVCALIDAGLRPASIAKSTQTSIATVRTHLRGIYAKTGLDGMVGVLSNLKVFSDHHGDVTQ